MTVEFLQEVVYDHCVAKQMDGYNKLLVNCFRYHSSSPKRKALLENEITRRAEYKADNEPSFTWQLFISEDNQQNSPEMYKSDRFWWCGFEYLTLSLRLHPRSQGLSAARVLPRPWDTPNRNCKKTCTNF